MYFLFNGRLNGLFQSERPKSVKVNDSKNDPYTKRALALRALAFFFIAPD